MIQVLIGGDICPVGDIEIAFTTGNAYEIFHDLLDEIACADLSIVNLESPLILQETPIQKAGGFVLGVSTRCVQGFVAAKWHVLNLANNHSFDHGPSGLQSTIDAIKDAGLTFVGAGFNIQEAQKPFVREINGESIVVYSMAEHEFNVADENNPGANPLDLINFVNAVRQYKQQGIFIVLLHGGKEYYPYPSPEMIRRCRFMVDMGADAVICCHTHCPLPWEIYSERPIVYGLGNLIFETWDHTDSWHEGYLAKLIIEKRQVHLQVIPYHQSKKSVGAQRMDKNEKKQFLDEMQRKCIQIKDAIFIQSQWVNYCREQKDIYLSILSGYRRPMKKIRRLLLPILHSKKETQRALLLVQCESHREILNTIFRDERK